MKKFAFMVACAALTLAACAKTQSEQPKSQTEFTITVDNDMDVTPLLDKLYQVHPDVLNLPRESIDLLQAKLVKTEEAHSLLAAGWDAGDFYQLLAVREQYPQAVPDSMSVSAMGTPFRVYAVSSQNVGSRGAPVLSGNSLWWMPDYDDDGRVLMVRPLPVEE